MADESKVSPDLEPQFDRSKLGKVLGEADITVTEEAILQFAEAVGETNPRFSQPGPDLEALPGMLAIINRPQARVQVRFPFATVGMPAGTTMEMFESVRPGDVLHVSVKLADVYVKTGRSGTMGFVVYDKEFVRKRDGKLVARVRQSSLTRP